MQLIISRWVISSSVEAKELQLQVEQTISKEDQSFSNVQENRRSGKSRSSSRTKNHRRSPYPVSQTEFPTTASSADGYTSPATPASIDRPSYSDYSSDMSVQVPSGYTPSLMYASSHEGVDSRYAALYTSAYGHPGLYGEASMGMYPYSTAYHRYSEERSPYGNHYEDKYYSGRDSGGVYSGYGASDNPSGHGSSQESVRVLHSPSQRESSCCHQSGTPVSLPISYDSCLQSGSNSSGSSQSTSTCPRSSSREDPYSTVQHTDSGQAHSYTYSSSSRPGVNHTSSTPDSASHSVADKKKSHHTISGGGPSIQSSDPVAQAKTSSSRSKAEPSLHSRREEKSSKSTAHNSSTTSSLGSTDSKTVQAQQPSVIMRRSTVVAPSPETDLGSCSRVDGQDGSKGQSGSNAMTESTHAISSRSSTFADMSSAMNLYGGASQCTYDAYSKAGAFGSSALQTSQRGYPLMPQPGYTSVIVDAQQYHMANGYVH